MEEEDIKSSDNKVDEEKTNDSKPTVVPTEDAKKVELPDPAENESNKTEPVPEPVSSAKAKMCIGSGLYVNDGEISFKVDGQTEEYCITMLSLKVWFPDLLEATLRGGTLRGRTQAETARVNKLVNTLKEHRNAK